MKERNAQRSRNSIADMFVLIVFAVFAIAVVTVLSLGISSYQKLVDGNDVAYEERTCVQYIYSKLQHAEDLERIYAEKNGSDTALVIEEDYEGEVYYTKIYVYDGWLCENFSADADMIPETGEKIVPANNFSVVRTDNLISINIETERNKNLEISYSLDTGKGQTI